ncbi:hypothetical protein BAUCODRAFT_22491 [Baudoinia panamericana UAMH 10762]|uniref:Uncharacterized protein n=1 Tax=Baudoinia panamericana (strain UAMH 10762) TaxID=717646 RepID=M2NIJ7_BAUPA|nr:uncharacterized protein BAUCODRAFT_22491 [Baudoinia panamericana UAMH 10762]EMC99224.1 hypothetical protein BAUCODRAFT_22491 [Baudoinia panamericana UAMH 10762]
MCEACDLSHFFPPRQLHQIRTHPVMQPGAHNAVKARNALYNSYKPGRLVEILRNPPMQRRRRKPCAMVSMHLRVAKRPASLIRLKFMVVFIGSRYVTVRVGVFRHRSEDALKRIDQLDIVAILEKPATVSHGREDAVESSRSAYFQLFQLMVKWRWPGGLPARWRGWRNEDSTDADGLPVPERPARPLWICTARLKTIKILARPTADFRDTLSRVLRVARSPQDVVGMANGPH